MSKIDISKIVKEVKGRYGKKTGLACDVGTGTDTVLSTSDSAYVLSDRVEFWKPLVGIRGIPYGRIIQISGKEDSGKSTTAMLFMKAAEDSGSVIIFWDSEKKFDVSRYRDRMGGNPDNMLVSRSKLIVEGAKQVAWFIDAVKSQDPNKKILVVWDSVGSTQSSVNGEDENDDYSRQPGVDAREVGFALKKLVGRMERYRNPETGEDTIGILCINQVYANIGSHGHKERGGSQLAFLSSVIVQLTRKKDLVKTRGGFKIKYGILTRAKVKKNHLFSGEDCVAELDLIVTADGIFLEDKTRNHFLKTGVLSKDCSQGIDTNLDNFEIEEGFDEGDDDDE